MSAPAIVQPDLEAFVLEQVDATGITVRAVGLVTDWPQWQRRYVIQVDARHRGGPAAAYERAETARQIVCGLPDVDWPAGVITYVQPVTGPLPLPDDDGCPRYTAQYEIRCHPRPTITAEKGH